MSKNLKQKSRVYVWMFYVRTKNIGIKRHFFMPGVKKTNPGVPNDFVRNIFFVFLYRPHKMYFWCDFFFCTDRHFSYKHLKFLFEFFNSLKCVKSAFCITGLSAPVSQNIMSKTIMNWNYHIMCTIITLSEQLWCQKIK